MEFRDTVLKRRMVRNFADKPVDPAIIDRILELTRHAPHVRKRNMSKEDLLLFFPRHQFCSSPVQVKLRITAAIRKPTKSMKMEQRSSGPCPTGSWILAAQ